MFKPLKRLRDRGSARDSHNLLTFATVSRGALIAPHAHVTHELNNPQKGEAVRRRLQDKTTPLTLFAKTVTSDAIMSIMDMNSLHLCTGKRDDVPITENVMLSLRLRSRSLPRWYCSSSPRARAQMPFAVRIIPLVEVGPPLLSMSKGPLARSLSFRIRQRKHCSLVLTQRW